MNPVLSTVRDNLSKNQAMPSNKHPKPRTNKSVALSYSSSSGYSTQSLSELDYQSSKNNLNSKNDNTSQMTTPSYSQSSSQASLNHPSNLNILNPTNLCSTSSVTDPSIMSYMRTSTPTNHTNSRNTFHQQESLYAHYPDNPVKKTQKISNKINFNPTCNSSLHSLSKDTWVKRIDYDSDYSEKPTPLSSILSHEPHSISNIQPHVSTIEHQPRIQFQSRSLPAYPEAQQQRLKWSSPVSQLLTFVVKLFSCFNIFSLVKSPRKPSTERVLTRKPTKTNHTVIQLYQANMEQTNDQLRPLGQFQVDTKQHVQSSAANISDNLNGSFIDTDSNYFRFSTGSNYVASTPIDTINRKQKHSIVSINNYDEKETYDNVPTEATNSTKDNSTKSSNFCETNGSLTSLSTMSSTQVGLNINMPSKYSTFIKSPIYEPAKSNSVDSIGSIMSSSESSETSDISKKSDYFLTLIELKKAPNKTGQNIYDYSRSDFVQGTSQTRTNFLRIIDNSKYRYDNSGPQRQHRRPVYEDVLCDKEVESYFVDQSFGQPQMVHQMVHNPKLGGCGYMAGVTPAKVIRNRGFQSQTDRGVLVRNIKNSSGLIGAGLVRQSHGESYC